MAMSGGTEVIQLSAALLRNQAPDLVLRLGSTVAARVLERHGARGLISIGNAVLAAELPAGVEAGDRLRLLVQDATTERVVLKLVDQPAAQQPAVAAASVPLPGGATARIVVDEDAAREEGGRRTEHSVAVTYNSPSLGSMRFRLSLDRGTVAVTVRAAPGEPISLAEQGAAELRDALARATGRAAQVTVLPTDDPLDVYA
jgi:hypothetical protein